MANVAVSMAVTLGGMFLQSILTPAQTMEGSRLSDINVPAVNPGNPIVRHWGTMKLGSQLIWTSKLIETRHEESQGGKGMGPKSTSVTYTYSVDCALGICQGPVSNVKRVRANQKLIWVNPEFEHEQAGAFDDAFFSEGTRLLENDVDAEEAHAGAFFFAFNEYRTDEYTPATINEAKAYVRAHPLPDTAPNWATVDELFDRMFMDLDEDLEYEGYKRRFDAISIYLGSQKQMPDPTIESYKGVGQVPAYRGTCYMVLTNMQLEDFGNSMPTFNVEVVREDGTVQLHHIIADVCRESGMSENEFNVSCGMNDVNVHGFAVTDRMSGRDAIQQLQQLFPFDACETAYILRFAHSERRPQALLRRGDFGAHVQNETPPSSEEVIRAHDFDMPRKLILRYQEPTRNYSMNTATSQRMVTESNLEEELSIAIALARPEAKRLIEGALARRFYARRTHKVTLPRKYSVLEPGDVVLVPERDDDDYHYALRVLEIALGNNGLVEATLSAYHQPSHIEAITHDEIEEWDDESQPAQGSRTYAYMLDLPLLSDTEADNVGFYALLTGVRSGWGGGVLLADLSSGGTVPAFGMDDPVSVSGASWVVAAGSDANVAHGFTMTKMDPNSVAGLFDYETKLRVRMLDTGQVLYSHAEQTLLDQPVNVAVIDQEIVQFARAVDLGNGFWELSGFLRGLRGTEWAIPDHPLGGRFVLLARAALSRVTHDQSKLNISARYRSVSSGDDADGQPDIWFTDTGNSLRPYAPHLRRADRDDTDAITVEWLPRVRQNGGLYNGQGTILDQPTEEYVVEVLNAGVVVRTETVATREWVYSAANHAADFGSIQDTVHLRLYQVGRIVGKGFPKEITV